MAEESSLNLSNLLDEGFVDPSSHGALHPALRGEAGLRLALWLRDGGVTPWLLSEAAEILRRSGESLPGEVGREGFRDLVLAVVCRHGLDRTGRLALFLRAALDRVDGPAQWEGLLLLVGRTATLITLDSASGPLPPPPVTAAGPETVPVYPRPKLWHCIYCGWRCDQEFNDYFCGGCKAVRPFAGGSATMIQCGVCRGMSLALARFCEWCGASFAGAAEAGGGTSAAAPSPAGHAPLRAEGEELYCIFCGSACGPTAGGRTCGSCGREVPDPLLSSAGKMCRGCQGYNLLAASYCERCGERFGGSETGS